MSRRTRDPRTRAEWQNAVDAAHALLAIDAARQYGLIEGGPKIDPDRCWELLDRGLKKGIRPSPGCVERMIDELNAPAPLDTRPSAC